MFTAYSAERPPTYWAATDPLGDIGHIHPLHPDFERNPYAPLVQRRNPQKKSPEKEPRKPQDPEHKVDDYA